MISILMSMSPFSLPPLLFISLFLSFAGFIQSHEVVSKDGLKSYHELELPKVAGPESVAFDCHGKGPYASVSDGRILKWKGASKGWTEFAVTSPNRDRKLCDGSTDANMEPTCGRPLGLKFDLKTCDLYIADAYFGLLVVGPRGGVAKQLATSADDGVPFRFTNGLDIDYQTGVVYFSDSSSVYQRREWPMISLKGDKTGRLLKYNPYTKNVQVLLKGLGFANGVALSKDCSFLLLAESDSRKILKFWLQGAKAYTSEHFAKLERTPDNIKRNRRGEFWVALNSGRRDPQNLGNTSMQNEVQKPWTKGDPVGVKFDKRGSPKEVLDGKGRPELESISEVEEHNGSLWIGSVVKTYVAVTKV